MSNNQKALFLESKQGRFVVGTRPIPKPGTGQLLVKLHTAALNPVDYKIQQTGAFVENYPAVLGVDIAGVVEEVGQGVQNFATGDKVFAHGSLSDDQSSYQQYAIAVANFTAKVPPNLSIDQAATVPLGFDTASIGLYSADLGAGLTAPWAEGGKGKYANKPIVIMGGSSSVGMYALQLARLSGFSPIITTASLAHEAKLKALGATHVIDRQIQGNDFLQTLHNITQQPIEIAYDTIAIPQTQKTVWPAVAPGGTLVMTLQPVVAEDQGRNRKIVATYGSPHAQPNVALCRGSWDSLSKWLEEGVIKPNPVEVLPNGLNGIPDGLERMKAGKTSGVKLVVHPQETA